MNNWPLKERPGVPSDPSTASVHQVIDGSGFKFFAEWDPGQGWKRPFFKQFVGEDVAATKWKYLGPISATEQRHSTFSRQ